MSGVLCWEQSWRHIWLQLGTLCWFFANNYHGHWREYCWRYLHICHPGLNEFVWRTLHFVNMTLHNYLYAILSINRGELLFFKWEIFTCLKCIRIYQINWRHKNESLTFSSPLFWLYPVCVLCSISMMWKFWATLTHTSLLYRLAMIWQRPMHRAWIEHIFFSWVHD